MNKGKLIVLEGGEGVGKSSNLSFLQEALSEKGIRFVSTREPGGTILGEAIRGILLKKYNDPINIDAELLLMFAARAEHLQKVILPALEKGHWVLSDRFTDASYAYQGGGRQIPFSRIAQLEQWVQGDLRPDLVLLLDAPIEVGLKRIQNRHALDRFEQEQVTFFQHVRDAYLRRAQSNPAVYKVINADQPLNDVQRALAEELDQFITPNYN